MARRKGKYLAAAPNTKPVYDRVQALAYARAYWITPASDGYIVGPFGAKPYRKVPEGTRFVHDVTYDAQGKKIHTEHVVLPPPPAPADGGSVPEVIPWDFIDDCTHFMSCCVGWPRI